MLEKSEIDNTSASFDTPPPHPPPVCVSPYTLGYADTRMIYFQLHKGLITAAVEINKDQGLSV